VFIYTVLYIFVYKVSLVPLSRGVLLYQCMLYVYWLTFISNIYMCTLIIKFNSQIQFKILLNNTNRQFTVESEIPVVGSLHFNKSVIVWCLVIKPCWCLFIRPLDTSRKINWSLKHSPYVCTVCSWAIQVYIEMIQCPTRSICRLEFWITAYEHKTVGDR